MSDPIQTRQEDEHYIDRISARNAASGSAIGGDAQIRTAHIHRSRAVGNCAYGGLCGHCRRCDVYVSEAWRSGHEPAVCAGSHSAVVGRVSACV